MQAAYREKGYTDEQIGERLVVEIPDNEYFNSRGIYNYHGGGTILFDDENILNWITSKSKWLQRKFRFHNNLYSVREIGYRFKINS